MSWDVGMRAKCSGFLSATINERSAMNTRTTRKFKGRAVLWALVLFVTAMVAEAKTCIWSGGGTPVNGDLYWTDADNWEDGNVPEDGDTVSFAAKSSTPHRLNMNIELENLFYTNSFGAKFNGRDNQLLGLSGSGSEIVVDSAAMDWLQPIRVSANAKLAISNSTQISLKSPCRFSGSGEVEKTGSGAVNFYLQNEGFSGMWRFRSGEYKTANNLDYALGSSSAVAHFYSSALFRPRGTVRYRNALFFHDCNPRVYRTATFDGDVTFISEQSNGKVFYLEGCRDSAWYSEESPPAFVMNGAVVVDESLYTGHIVPCSNGITDYFAEFNGTLNLGSYYLEFEPKNVASDRGYVRINTPIVTTHSIGLMATYSGTVFYCGADEVLGGSGHMLQFGRSNRNSDNLCLDLCGHNQTVGRLLFNQKDGYTTSGSITSSNGPATLFVKSINDGTGHHTVFALDGEVSLSLEKGDATWVSDFMFSGGSTTGWIFSDYPACNLTQAAFTNLSGISLRGTGIAFVNSTTALKSGVKFDFDNLTTGYLRVDTGVSLRASQVVNGDVDVAEGIYCRAGAGVVGATEVSWLGGDGYNGTVTVLAHDPVLVWTGAGDGSLTDAANWGANESPDLTDSSLTLDFRRATAANPVVLSGTIAPVATITSGDVNKGTPHFAGEGTLVLGGTAVETNNLVFTGNASLTYNGTGTLVLKGSVSSTMGTLTVASGKVVLDSSAWYGEISIASGAELEVLSSCGTSVFTMESGKTRCKIQLDGCLALSEGVEAEAKSLMIGGESAHADRTYGSGESSAMVKDDTHFAGKGTIFAHRIPGMVMIIK